EDDSHAPGAGSYWKPVASTPRLRVSGLFNAGYAAGRLVGLIASWTRQMPFTGCNGTVIVFDAVDGSVTVNGFGVVPLTAMCCVTFAKRIWSVCTGIVSVPRTQARRSHETFGPVHESPCQPSICVAVRRYPFTR